MKIALSIKTKFSSVFKNGKLIETTTSTASENVKWTETYIHLQYQDPKDGYNTRSLLIDRISGTVTDSRGYFHGFLSYNKFEGICRATSQQF